MLQHRYRWVYAFAFSGVIFLLSFFYDVQPSWSKLKHLNNAKKSLQRKLAGHPFVHPVVMSKPPSSTEVLSDLFRLANEKGIQLQSVKVTSPTATFMLQGDFQQLTSFIGQLTQSMGHLLLLDFSYKSIDANHFALMMTVLMTKNNLSNSPPVPFSLLSYNPFCLAGNVENLNAQNALIRAHMIPIEQIKMVGYLQQGERHQALLLLPEGLVVAVEQGMEVGKEKGVVMTVQAENVVVRLPDKRQLIITL